uniref:PiggyBac transposable element-derived protein domain-containing protein n=1 Tax=Phytophthora ramorum TaxID=164328 RepID=H3H696_PHYRM
MAADVTHLCPHLFDAIETPRVLNNDSDDADWEFEASEAEEADESAEDAADDEGGAAAESDGEEAPPVSTSLSAQRRTGNAYVDHLIQESGLHIVRDREVRTVYKDRGELGLLSLFFTREFRTSLQTWTNKMLKTKGRLEAMEFEIDAYIGLEIAISFNPVTDIKELWSQKLFMGQSDFALTMARNRFESIRARFQVHAPESIPVERRELDPLWHSRRLMAQIQEKFATIAVPVGAVSLNENTVRTKARSSAKTFLPSKPDKYGVRFYVVVGWESLCAYSVWDNGSGNRTRTTPAERYVGVFPALRTPFFRTLDLGDIPISRKDPSALWVAMCGHLTKQNPAQDGHRRLVCDNFYTRHNLAKTLMAITDDVAPGWEKLQEKHKRAQKKLPPHLQMDCSGTRLAAAGALTTPRDGDDSAPSAVVAASRTEPVRKPWMPSQSEISSRFGATVPPNLYALYSCNAIVDDDVAKRVHFDPLTNQRRDYYIGLFHELRWFASKKTSRRSKVPEWQALCQSWSAFVENFNKNPAGYRDRIRQARERYEKFSKRVPYDTALRITERDVNGYTSMCATTALAQVLRPSAEVAAFEILSNEYENEPDLGSGSDDQQFAGRSSELPRVRLATGVGAAGRRPGFGQPNLESRLEAVERLQASQFAALRQELSLLKAQLAEVAQTTSNVKVEVGTRLSAALKRVAALEIALASHQT